MARNRAGRRSRALELGLILAAAAGGVAANADWSAPPRFDGAGYAILARGLATGRGYRALDHPDQPRHAHFPPGYPLALAAIDHAFGEKPAVAHAFSAVCAVLACAAAWLWFRQLYAGPTALVLGLALGLNWLWTRTGSAIQSEPLYLLLTQAAVLAHAPRGGRRARSALTGVLLGLCVITRWAGVGLVAAVLGDLVWKKRLGRAFGIGLAAAVITLPWLAWTLTIARDGGATAAGLLDRNPVTLIERVAEQAVFYLERIPDALFGPYVEAAMGRGALVQAVALACAACATALTILGWALGRRRRFVALIALFTLGLLLVWPYTEAGRFLIPLIPCLLIGMVEGLGGVLGEIGRRLGFERTPARRRLAAAWLILAAAIPYSGYQIATGKARERSAAEREFASACRWLANRGDRPGPVLARHPGDVYWRTGRAALEVESAERPGFADAASSTIADLIRKYRVAYVLVDRDLYAGAPPGPLARFVADRPQTVRLVWPEPNQSSRIAIYEVRE